jgi:hypothetical protein
VSVYRSDSTFVFTLPFSDLSVQGLKELYWSDIYNQYNLWDKHCASRDRIGDHYKGISFEKYSERITLCSPSPGFRLVSTSDKGLFEG